MSLVQKLVECVPNFSEGRDADIIKQITDSIQSVEGVKLLDVDPGKATNRTVVTFVGAPDAVIEAAFQGFKKAAEIIDMRGHKGEHPRFGATDVCPFVPLRNVTMDEAVEYARRLGKRVGEELDIPVYLYERAATTPERENLSVCRAGEYEGLPKKLADPKWKPDFGPAEWNEQVRKTGVSAIGARNFLVAYNVNLNTSSVRRANAIAFDVREQGRIKRIGDPVTGEIVHDENGEPIRIPGKLKKCKAIGWYIEEYGIAQISINLTDISVTPIHVAFEEVCNSADQRGIRVTGSEIVGLVPKQALLDAGKFFLAKQKRSLGVSEDEIIKIAVKSLGLNDVSPFDPKKKIIELVVEEASKAPLVNMSLQRFANELASESPAPGGGSVAALAGALGVGLGTMVANLSSHKRGWDSRWQEFSVWAEKGQALKEQLLFLVDEDTRAFNQLMKAFGLPKGAAATAEIELATKRAIEAPLQVMRQAVASVEVLRAMSVSGVAASASDVGVGILCARTAVLGAFLNVKINCGSLKDKEFAERVLQEGAKLVADIQAAEAEVLANVEKLIAEPPK